MSVPESEQTKRLKEALAEHSWLRHESIELSHRLDAIEHRLSNLADEWTRQAQSKESPNENQ